MEKTELQILYENRQPGETLNQTKERLIREKKLVVPKVELPATYEPIPEEKEDEEGFQAGDLVIPRWRIMQPTTRQDKATPGKFRNTLTGEEREKLENVIFLKRQNGRVLFVKDDYTGKRLCWSWDGMKPATEDIIAKTGEQPKSPICMTGSNGNRVVHCPLAQWVDRKAPECKETVSFLGLDAFVPFFISFHGTALPIIKNFISSVYLKKKQAVLQGKNLQLRDFRVTLGLKLEINERGKFYLPVVEKMEEIKAEEERRLLTQCFESLNKRSLAETVAVEEKSDV